MSEFASSLSSSSSSSPPIETLYGHRVAYHNKAEFHRKFDLLKEGGPTKLNIVSDFDFTLTRFHMSNGERGASCYKVLEDCGLLTHEYHVQAQALQLHYYPLEVDPSLDSVTRTNYMIEWVEKANVLLSQSGLSKQIIETAVCKSIESNKFALRDKVTTFLSELEAHHVPVLIFSAGIYDVLDCALRYFKDSINRSLLYVISNRPIFDGPQGQISVFEEPVIHVFNKKAETFLQCHDYFKQPRLEERTNLILIGDSLGDVTMSDGMSFHADSLLKIGFLNDRVERLPQYLEAYDVVILGDPDFEVPLTIVRLICESNVSNNNVDR